MKKKVIITIVILIGCFLIVDTFFINILWRPKLYIRNRITALRFEINKDQLRKDIGNGIFIYTDFDSFENYSDTIDFDNNNCVSDLTKKIGIYSGLKARFITYKTCDLMNNYIIENAEKATMGYFNPNDSISIMRKSINSDSTEFRLNGISKLNNKYHWIDLLSKKLSDKYLIIVITDIESRNMGKIQQIIEKIEIK